MSLQKQLVHLNMSGGLQKKDDSSLVIPSKLLRADNVEFDDVSTLKTRGGQVSVTIPAGYSVPTRAFVLNDGMNVEFADGATIRVNGLSGASDYANWRGSALSYEPSKFMRVGVTTRRLFQAPSASTQFDIACGVSNYCIAWPEQDANLGEIVQVSIRDLTTDVEVQRNVIVGAASSEIVSQPRVIYDSTNARFSIFTYHEDTAFVTASTKGSYVAESGGAFTGPNTLITMSYAAGGLAPAMDAAIYQGQGYCIATRDGDFAGAIRMRLVNLSHGNIAATTTAVPAAAAASLTAHATYSGAVLTGHCFHGAGANVRGYRLPSNTGVMSAETTISTLPSGIVGRIVVTDAGGGVYLTCDNPSSTSSTYATTYVISATTAHVFVSRTAVDTNCFVDGRSFTMRSRTFVPMVFTSSWNQSTHFVLDITEAAENLGVAVTAKPAFVSRIDYGELSASGYASNTTARVRGTDVSLVAYTKYETDLRMAGTTNDTRVAIAAARFSSSEQLGSAEINGTAFLAGALPLVCDGYQIVEEGFHWGPEVVSTSIAPVTTGTGIYSFPNTTGTYSVAFTEGWLDAKGNWHESAVAGEYEVSITAGSGLLDINPTVIRPPSLKRGRYLIMYRTLRSSTDTALYLAHAGDLSSGTVSEVSDTDLASGEQIYTSGGVLPNTPAPSCRHVGLFQKRLVLSGCGDGSRVYWSKVSTPGYGVEFSSGDPLHQTTVPAERGRAVATAEMDDRLIVLCERGVGIIGGNGPSSTGTAGQYSDFSTIITETGCEWDSPKSVIRGPEGVWFRSPFGIRLVSRSGALARGQDGKQIGAEVDALVSGNIVAVAGDARQQVRFFQSSGTCLVWDYQWQQWTRFTGIGNNDAVYAGGRFYTALGGATDLIRYISDSSYTEIDDAGDTQTEVTGDIETAWLSFAGIQGFQRIYRLMLLGKDAGVAGGDHVITLNANFDFNDTTGTENASVTTAASNGVVQLQHHFARQKCEALKLRVLFNNSANTDARLRLTDLTLQVGVKFGYNKLPSSARF